MTDDRNRAEQRAARKLAAEQGIKYTAALRRVRAAAATAAVEKEQPK